MVNLKNFKLNFKFNPRTLNDVEIISIAKQHSERICNAFGLDKDYAFDWSYGIPETFTLLVPGVTGGGYISRGFSENSRFVEKLQEIGIPENSGQQYAARYGYWGTQRDTAGPVYLGAVICFLFIFGMIFLILSFHFDHEL